MPLRLGVVIPTLDRPDAMLRCVRSVLAGAVLPDVCIVVDQSDGDETREALQSGVDDPRVRYLRSHGRGLSRALNEGLGATGAEIVGITGDDCTVDVGWLKGVRDAFAATPDLGMVFGTILPTPHDSDLGFVPSYQPATSVIARTIAQKDRIGGTSACMAIRTTAWERLAGFDRQLGVGAPLRSAEDADLTLRALGQGIAVSQEPAIVVVHHGFFPWEERGELIWRNWYGTGAAFAKFLRLNPTTGARALLATAFRWTGRGSRVAAGLGHGAHRLQSARAFLSGFREGLRTGLDRGTGHFVSSD
jgi:GT2 family glycosyltransferase